MLLKKRIIRGHRPVVRNLEKVILLLLTGLSDRGGFDGVRRRLSHSAIQSPIHLSILPQSIQNHHFSKNSQSIYYQPHGMRGILHALIPQQLP
jgi:hypothetical protein